MKNKTVILTGIGQDGVHLSDHYLRDGYKVIALSRWQCKGYNEHMTRLMKNKNFKLIEGDITDRNLINRLLKEHQPEHYINTAAISHVGVSFNIPERTTDINYKGVLYALEGIKEYSPNTSFLQCSTSEMFGDNMEIPQNEKSRMLPNSPYAIAKLGAYHLTRMFRNYNIKTYNSICFNHEGPYRPENFVTTKIIKKLVEIKNGALDNLVLGNMDAQRDWGYAGDYTAAMKLMLESGKPDDYVLATGETHSVREFVEEACSYLNLDLKWNGKGIDEKGIINNKERIEISKDFYRPCEVNRLCGDASKIKNQLGWEAKVKYNDLVKIMCDYQLKKGGVDNERKEIGYSFW